MPINYKDFYFYLRRSLARIIDSFLIMLIFSYALFYFSKDYEIIRDFSSFLNPLLIVVISLFINIFIESFFISKFKSTFGKFLLSINVVDENGKNLSYFKSFKRAWLIYFKGLAMGVLFVTVISVLISFINYRKLKQMEWDKDLKINIVFNRFGVFNNIIIFVTILLFLSFFIKNYSLLDRSFYYLQNSRNYRMNLIHYKKESLNYLDDILIKNNKLVDLKGKIEKSKKILFETKKMFVFTDNVFANNLLLNENDIKNNEDAKKNVIKFLNFMDCSIKTKIDIFEYLNKNANSFKIINDKIIFKDSIDSYFFDLRLDHLNECKKLI